MSLQKKNKRMLPDSKKPNDQGKAKKAAKKETNGLAQEMKQTEEKYRNIVENIGVGVAMVNPAAPLFVVSCRTGEGLEQWVEWLVGQQGWSDKHRAPLP